MHALALCMLGAVSAVLLMLLRVFNFLNENKTK